MVIGKKRGKEIDGERKRESERKHQQQDENERERMLESGQKLIKLLEHSSEEENS